MTWLLGIDIGIGASGALALLDVAVELIDVADMPVLSDGPAGRPTVNAALFVEIIHRWRPAGRGSRRRFRLRTLARRRRGRAGRVRYSSGSGAPAAWKRAVGIPPGKDGAKDATRSEAIRRWPGKAALFLPVRHAERCGAAVCGSRAQREGRGKPPGLDSSSTDLFGGSQLARVPFNKGSLSLTWDPTPQWEIEPRLTVFDSRLDTNFLVFPDEKVTLAPYAKLDVYARYKVNDNVTMFARAENLTDTRYEETYDYGTAGRSIYGGVTINW